MNDEQIWPGRQVILAGEQSDSCDNWFQNTSSFKMSWILEIYILKERLGNNKIQYIPMKGRRIESTPNRNELYLPDET